MSKNKLLILIIVLSLVFANAGIAAAAIPVPVPQPLTLSLKVSISPITIYPPLVLFTATLSRVPPSSGTQLVVDYYQTSPDLCTVSESAMIAPCASRNIYLGSAKVNGDGQAVFSKQMKPGSYTVIARIKMDNTTLWSNNVSFQIK